MGGGIIALSNVLATDVADVTELMCGKLADIISKGENWIDPAFPCIVEGRKLDHAHCFAGKKLDQSNTPPPTPGKKGMGKNCYNTSVLMKKLNSFFKRKLYSFFA